MLKGRAEISTSDSLLFLKETDSGKNISWVINIIFIIAHISRGLYHLYTGLSRMLSHLDAIERDEMRDEMSSWVPGKKQVLLVC